MSAPLSAAHFGRFQVANNRDGPERDHLLGRATGWGRDWIGSWKDGGSQRFCVVCASLDNWICKLNWAYYRQEGGGGASARRAWPLQVSSLDLAINIIAQAKGFGRDCYGNGDGDGYDVAEMESVPSGPRWWQMVHKIKILMANSWCLFGFQQNGLWKGTSIRMVMGMKLGQRKARLKPSRRAALKSLRLAYEYGNCCILRGCIGNSSVAYYYDGKNRRKNGCIITLPATRMAHKSLMPVSLRFGIKREMMEPLKKAFVPRFYALRTVLYFMSSPIQKLKISNANVTDKNECFWL